MSARMTLDPCSTCKGGSVKLEQFQQRFPLQDGTGHVWLPEDLRYMEGFPPHALEELRSVALRDNPTNFRWQESPCPRCHGAREYWVEHVPCKIF